MQLDLEIEMPSNELAEDIAFSVRLNSKISRGKVSVDSKGKTLVLSIDAPDPTATRAALNTHLRLIDMLMKSWEVVENGGSKGY